METLDEDLAAKRERKNKDHGKKKRLKVGNDNVRKDEAKRKENGKQRDIYDWRSVLSSSEIDGY